MDIKWCVCLLVTVMTAVWRNQVTGGGYNLVREFVKQLFKGGVFDTLSKNK